MRKKDFLLCVSAKIVSFIHFEDERFPCMQRRLFYVKDEKAIIIMKTSAHNKASLREESVCIYSL